MALQWPRDERRVSKWVAWNRKRRFVVDGVESDSVMVRLMRRHLAWMGQVGYRATTVHARMQALERFALWSLARGMDSPLVVDVNSAEQYQRQLYQYRKRDGKPLSFGVQNGLIIAVQQWYLWLMRLKLCEHNPFAEIRLAKVEQRLPQALYSVEEVGRILAQPDIASAVGIRDRAILELFYATGMRRGELINLQTYDVDFAQRRVLLRETKTRVDRMVPMSERAVYWLERYAQEVRSRWCGKLPQSVPESFFMTARGSAISPTRLDASVKSYIQRAGLRAGACHGFRHSCATHMLERGADIRFVQELLGHGRLSSTQIYTRVTQHKLAEVYARTHPSAGASLLDAQA